MYRYVREARVFPQSLWFAAPVGILALLGALRDRRELGGRPWGLYLAALLAVQVKIPANGEGFLAHYYQYWLPLLAIGAGWAAGASRPGRGTLAARSLPAAGIAVGSFLLLQQGYYVLLPADEVSLVKYGTSVLEGRAMGRAIAQLLRPEERLYQHGDRRELYYYSGHLPPSPLLSTMFLNDTWPVAELLLGRHLAAIEEAPPDLIVVKRSVKPDPAPSQRAGLAYRLFGGRREIDKGHNAQKVLDVLLPGYRPARIEELRGFPDFDYYVRRSSPLDGRLGVGEGRESTASQ